MIRNLRIQDPHFWLQTLPMSDIDRFLKQTLFQLRPEFLNCFLDLFVTWHFFSMRAEEFASVTGISEPCNGNWGNAQDEARMPSPYWSASRSRRDRSLLHAHWASYRYSALIRWAHRSV